MAALERAWLEVSLCLNRRRSICAGDHKTAHTTALLDQLLGGADAKTAFDPKGLLDDLKKALAERALNAEIDHHLDGERSKAGPTAGTATARRRC